LALCRTLVKMEVGLVAIERPDGVLVERLLDAGLKVLALHPNKQPGTGSVSREASPIASTRSCSASSPGLTIIASEFWNQTRIRPERCAR
jgi:hypothetical protein